MEDRLDYKIVGLGILFLLCWMGFAPLAVRSAVVWYDDFNDGNYDGWTICTNPVYSSGSNWSATNGYLECYQWFEQTDGIISHPSDTVYGTWSLDFKANETQFVNGTGTGIGFISSNLDGDLDSDWDLYWVSFMAVVTSEGKFFRSGLHKSKEGVYTNLARYEPLIPVAGWHHMNVTRNEAGLFSVYHNGVLIMQGEDTDRIIDTSELFVLYSGRGLMIDNVVVDDVPIPQIPWLLIAVVGGSAVVIVAVAVVFLRRR